MKIEVDVRDLAALDQRNEELATLLTALVRSVIKSDDDEVVLDLRNVSGGVAIEAGSETGTVVLRYRAES